MIRSLYKVSDGLFIYSSNRLFLAITLLDWYNNMLEVHTCYCNIFATESA